MVKPVQTGAADGDSDADEVHRLTGVRVQECTALDEPLAPDTAARRQGVGDPARRGVRRPDPGADSPRHRDRRGRRRACWSGSTPTAARCSTSPPCWRRPADDRSSVVVVVAAGLGTLNHTELTVGAIRAPRPRARRAGHRRLAGRARAGRAVQPRGPAARSPALLVVAILPEGSGSLDRETFLARAPGWFAPASDDPLALGPAYLHHGGAGRLDRLGPEEAGGQLVRAAGALLPGQPDERRASRDRDHCPGAWAGRPTSLKTDTVPPSVDQGRSVLRKEMAVHTFRCWPGGCTRLTSSVIDEASLRTDEGRPGEAGGLVARAAPRDLGRELVADVRGLDGVVLGGRARDRRTVAQPLERRSPSGGEAARCRGRR